METEKSTTTTLGDKNNVGPFNQNEILVGVKKSITALGLDYDKLEGIQKEAFVAQAIGALTGVPPAEVEKNAGKITQPGMAIEFRKLVLQEFQNSPKWDQDEFVKGYKSAGPIGTGNVRTEELHESRR
jgi:hypothetical protein